jgi:hypothetical protein
LPNPYLRKNTEKINEEVRELPHGRRNPKPALRLLLSQLLKRDGHHHKVSLTKCGVILAFVLCFATLTRANQQSQELKPCATDPTYKIFESRQQDLYESLPAAKAELIEHIRLAKLGPDELIKAIRPLPNVLNVSPYSRSLLQYGAAKAASSEMQTCFEDPLTFAAIEEGIRRLDQARRAMNLKGSMPKFGSLPLKDINAYRYYFGETGGTVLAFNDGLWRTHFPDIAAASVRRDRIQEFSYRVSKRPEEEILNDILAHPEWGTSVEADILAGVGLPAPPQPLTDEVDVNLAVSLQYGMTLFVIAHEFSHEILGHHPASMASLATQTKGGAPDDLEISRVRWSWVQEIEADLLGIELVLRSLKDSFNDAGKRSRDAWLVAAEGAMLVFLNQDMLERAKFAKDSGVAPPPPLTIDERNAIAQIIQVDNSAEAAKKLPTLQLRDDHPSTLVRAEIIHMHLARAAHKRGVSKAAFEGYRLGEEAFVNMEVLCQMAEPAVLHQILTSAPKKHE